MKHSTAVREARFVFCKDHPALDTVVKGKRAGSIASVVCMSGVCMHTCKSGEQVCRHGGILRIARRSIDQDRTGTTTQDQTAMTHALQLRGTAMTLDRCSSYRWTLLKRCLPVLHRPTKALSGLILELIPRWSLQKSFSSFMAENELKAV